MSAPRKPPEPGQEPPRGLQAWKDAEAKRKRDLRNRRGKRAAPAVVGVRVAAPRKEGR